MNEMKVNLSPYFSNSFPQIWKFKALRSGIPFLIYNCLKRFIDFLFFGIGVRVSHVVASTPSTWSQTVTPLFVCYGQESCWRNYYTLRLYSIWYTTTLFDPLYSHILTDPWNRFQIYNSTTFLYKLYLYSWSLNDQRWCTLWNAWKNAFWM